MLPQGMEKKEIIKVLDNLDRFIVKGTVKKGNGYHSYYSICETPYAYLFIGYGAHIFCIAIS